MPGGPFVSIIIPCKRIDDYTHECVRHCRRLDYDDKEIILLPDDSGEAVEGVRVRATGPVPPGVKRNIGVKNSSGELCAFIDSDAYPREDWLRNAVRYFEDAKVGGVGGPGLTPEEDSLAQKASGYVLSSFMVGSLSSRYRTEESFESDDVHSCNFVARKSVVEEAGGWNEKYWPGEDTLMCLAIKKLGKKLIEASDVVVYHHRRSLFGPHLEQVSRFGEHRGFFVKRFPENSLKPTYVAPTVLVLSLLAGLMLSFVSSVFVYLLVVGVLMYLALSLVATILQVKSIKLVLLVFVGIVATHITYGVFFIFGLIRRDLKR